MGRHGALFQSIQPMNTPLSFPTCKVHKPTLLSQFDPLLFLGGSVAIAVGVKWLVFDPALPLTSRTENSLVERDQFIPLLTFGIASAIAWTCASCAIFRVASLETTHRLSSSKGVRPADLPNMLELVKFPPTLSWLGWRAKMWTSSLYAILCLGLYVSVGVTYRLASKDVVQIDEGVRTVNPLISLTDDVLSVYNRLLVDGSTAPQWVAPSLMSLLDENAIKGADGWTVQTGWHGHTTAAQIGERSRGWMLGYHVVGLTRNVSGEPWRMFREYPDGVEIFNTKYGELTVEKHLDCGSLLVMNTEADRHYWVGLGLARLNVTFQWSKQMTNYSIVEGELLLNGVDDCPLPLDTTVYDALIERVHGTGIYGGTSGLSIQMDLNFNDMLIDLSEPASNRVEMARFYCRNLQSKRPLYALLLAEVMRNPADLVLEPDLGRLIELDVLWDERPSDRSSTGSSTGTDRLFHFARYDVFTQYVFRDVQILCSALLIGWGALLLVMAWPYRGIIITGRMEQYMKFAADLGTEEEIIAMVIRYGF
ncbi:hypothetical protein QBC37DRAFT_465713 [Rhypophila decipiens]|uniref:Uncharacterized protein n=1 Tax=Rhypophila decipiens TaxID=261697 RepID=A0AAN7B917_9PEZI|nr:hypothetical protein QBC37DRAFT_465713 [Rhypophila decipiens]